MQLFLKNIKEINNHYSCVYWVVVVVIVMVAVVVSMVWCCWWLWWSCWLWWLLWSQYPWSLWFWSHGLCCQGGCMQETVCFQRNPTRSGISYNSRSKLFFQKSPISLHFAIYSPFYHYHFSITVYLCQKEINTLTIMLFSSTLNIHKILKPNV